MIKLVHQSLHSELRPKYLLAEFSERRRNLRPLEQEQKVKHGDKNGFQQQATMYNEFPHNEKNNKAKGYYKGQALARALTI